MIDLVDPVLGTLTLKADPFVVTSFEIGSRVSRPVMRQRALADGTFDDTRWVGGRAVTISLRLRDERCRDVTMQSLYDLLLPYMAPRRRPVMRWSLPGGGDVRQMTLRGDNAPIVIGGAKFPTIVCSFVSDGEITGVTQYCELIDPSEDVEQGRTYDEAPDRTYPSSPTIGERTLNVGGNEPAHWVGVIYGASENPFVTLNGVTINLDEGGGLIMAVGTYLTINTRDRTMFLNGDPTAPQYDLSNFTEWSWSDLLLQPGVNTIRYGDDNQTGQMQVCWFDTWC